MLELPDARRPCARGDVIVGIRPEALDHTRHGAAPARRSSCRSRSIEALGSDTLVHLELDAAGVVAPDVEQELAADGGGVAIAERAATLLTARLPPHTRAVPGRVLPVRVDTRALHYFDPETERAL